MKTKLTVDGNRWTFTIPVSDEVAKLVETDKKIFTDLFERAWFEALEKLVNWENK